MSSTSQTPAPGEMVAVFRDQMPGWQKQQKRRASRAPYYFILPAILALFLVGIFPFFYAIYISVHSMNLLNSTSDHMVGLQNFARLAQDSRAWHSLLVTAIYTVCSVVVETILGLAISVLLNRSFPGRTTVRALLLIPIVMTPVVVGLLWRIFYDPNAGIINYMLGLVGLGSHHDWLGNISTALGALIVTDVWQWTPFMILIITAGMDALPIEPFEAASIDGASRWQAFQYITLPLLRSTILVAVILRTIDSLKTFDTIYVMTEGGPGLATETANLYAYLQGFTYFNVSYATAFAFVFTVILSITCTIFVRRFVFSRRIEAKEA